MVDASSTGGRFKLWWAAHGTTFMLLLGMVVLALAVRSVFNYEASVGDGETFRWSGTDGYYHMRVVEHILTTGEHLHYDPLINYPLGAVNPRPPIFNWGIAIVAGLLAPFFGGDSLQAANYVAAFSPAVWGALSVLPLYFLGKATFGRKTGLWAAFFLALMPAHIQRSALGGLDHDATILFFLLLAAYFIVRALKVEHDDRFVGDWRSGASVARGFRMFWAANRLSLGWMTLAGISVAAIALVWQGWTYVHAVFALYYVVQLLVDNLRRRDAFATFNLMLPLMLVPLLLAYPYYDAVGRVPAHIMPSVYLFGAMLVASVVLVPARDLPPILVLPGVALAGVLGLALVYFALPDVWTRFATGLGYFVQSKLYSTIAEAQRTELGLLVFSTAIMPFFFAIAGVFLLAGRWWKGARRDHLFLLVFTGVAMFMAFAAARFIFNASVNVALLGGWVMVRIMKRIRFREVLDTWVGVRGGNTFWKSMRLSVRGKHVLSALFVGLMVVFPTLWFATDAGMSAEFRAEHVDNKLVRDYTGAFNQDFLSGSWVDALAFLATQDTDRPIEQRPAFIAWWDYGFYAVQEGKHPTVADPFQFGFQLSGRFLAAQSEEEAILYSTVRLLEADIGRNGGSFTAAVEAALEDVDPGLARSLATPLRRSPERDYDGAYVLLDRVLDRSGAVDLNSAVQRATGWSIRYFVVDGRMMPLDDPGTAFIDQGSIYYAPVFLANKNPDDFVRTLYVGTNGREYQVVAYETVDGNSVALPRARIVDGDGREYIASGGELLRSVNGQPDYSQESGIAFNRIRLDYMAPFYESMFYRAYVGTPPPTGQELPAFNNWAPGYNLIHFRLVHLNNQVRVLQYFEGAVLEGEVRTESGEPVDNARVQVFDDYSIPHDTALTDERGRYRVLLPFSTDVGNTTVQVFLGQTAVASRNFTVSVAQAERRADFNLTHDFELQDATLDAFVFRDVDQDGLYNASVDSVVEGARVHLQTDSATTGADGRARIEGLRPGDQALSVNEDHYEAYAATVSMTPDRVTRHNVALRMRDVDVAGVARFDGDGVAGIPLTFSPDAAHHEVGVASTNATGAYEVALQPGRWTVSGNGTVVEDNVTVRYEVVPRAFDLAFGTEAFVLNVELRRVG